MTDTLKPDFKAEYAKSNRSSCKHCQKSIEKDDIRLGKLERASNFDGEIYVWHHFNCFASKHGHLVGSATNIKGLTDLRWDDQQKLTKRFGGGAGDADEVFVSNLGLDEEDEEEEDGIEGWTVEYAKSGRSTCNKCFQLIANKDLRIGENSTDPNTGYSATRWFHADCFEVPLSMTDTSSLHFSSVNAKDKKKIQDLIDKAGKKNSKKRKEMEAEQQEKAEKRQKTTDEAKEKAEKLWKIKDKLKTKYNSNELKAILKYKYYTHSSGVRVGQGRDGGWADG